MTVFLAIAGVTLRALLGRRRSLLMVLLAGMPVLLGLIVRANEGDVTVVGPTIDGLVIRVVLPLIALVFGTAALGSELDDGTAIHLLTRPVSRTVIVLAKIAVAGTLTATLVVPSTLLAGILMGGLAAPAIGVTFAYAIAVLVGSYIYVAIFVALTVTTSRGLILGLGYSLIWEGLLAGLLPGSQVFSVREYLRGIAATLYPAADESLVGAGAVLYALVAFILATAWASARLRVYEIRGAD